MIRILLPLFAVLLVVGCLLLSGQGWKSLDDPAVVLLSLLLIGMSCIPAFRQATRLRRWLGKLPWFRFALVWNVLGGLFILPILVFPTWLPEPPGWLVVIFLLWFFTMPFTAFGASVVLWHNRRTFVSKLLLVYCWVLIALWCLLLLMPARMG
jgi:hypothetical protein